MRITVRPAADPGRELDLTHRLVSAIAEELWRLYGGNEQLNWIEAERHLEQIALQARTDPKDALVIVAAAPAELALAGSADDRADVPPPASRPRRPDSGPRSKQRQVGPRPTGKPCAQRGISPGISATAA